MKTSIGVDGRRVLATLYRLGCLTAAHLSIIEDMPRSTAQGVLQALRKNRLVDQRDEKLPWSSSRRGRSPAHFYLSKRDNGTAILHGAEAAGARLRGRKDRQQAIERYARCGIPYQIPHRWLGNAACIELLKSAAKVEDVAVAASEIHSESSDEFPLRIGDNRKIYPDGVLPISFEDVPQRFYVETETNERRADLLSKIDAYSSLWLTMRGEAVSKHKRVLQARFRVPDDARAQGFAETWVPIGFAGLTPVIFIYPVAETAAKMRLYAFNAVRESRASLTSYLRLSEKWESHGIRSGWFFLFVGLDELQADALGPYFMPVSAFDDEWGRFEVPLRACASVVEQCYRLENDLRTSWKEKIDEGRAS